uniref:SFRICE_035818 n=1 Tax=Spodoptera frugiperda TaxID=7108 RepID=A0A2H1VB63_SPOFR
MSGRPNKPKYKLNADLSCPMLREIDISNLLSVNFISIPARNDFVPKTKCKCGRAVLRHEWAGSTGVIPWPHRKPTVGGCAARAPLADWPLDFRGCTFGAVTWSFPGTTLPPAASVCIGPRLGNLVDY